ncbi:gluconokinase [Paraburkholderia bannensis]|uniref:gluconokinase n=1 Tax=Paraburkholderia bannensis TaxID=765414 RepID=UPI002AB284D0|nr:gluconokinase [Paraburkholderia bannensis]
MNRIRSVVLMGVSGCGKSTLARALAERLDWQFVEGDDCHPPGNIQKMSAGLPLTDEDRLPFLHNVAIAIQRYEPGGVVASCSALKRQYRDFIRSICRDTRFVLPVLPREALVARLQARPGHFMPASLIDSQLATLEMPASADDAIVVDGLLPLEVQLDRVIERLDPGARIESAASR